MLDFHIWGQFACSLCRLVLKWPLSPQWMYVGQSTFLYVFVFPWIYVWLFCLMFVLGFLHFFPPIFALRIAPWVININIDIVDKRIVFPSNFHLPFSRRDSEQPTCRLIPHLSAESCLFRWWHYLGQLTRLKHFRFQKLNNNGVIPRWAGCLWMLL